MEDVNRRRRIFLFRSLKLSTLLKKSTPGKFDYICHFQQIGIKATVFEKREFILKVTFSPLLRSSMLKLPIDTMTPTSLINCFYLPSPNLRAVVSPRSIEHYTTKVEKPLRATSCFSIEHAHPRGAFQSVLFTRFM